MKIDSGTIEKMAHLARLNVEESDKDGISKSLEQILSWMEKLNELNTDHVEPLVHLSAEINGLRPDKASSPIPASEALQNAPSTDGLYFRVPKVLDL